MRTPSLGFAVSTTVPHLAEALSLVGVHAWLIARRAELGDDLPESALVELDDVIEYVEWRINRLRATPALRTVPRG